VIPLVELEKAYIAGIVDGEGTVTLAKHHKNETPIPFVSVANNNLKLLQWIKHRFGGLIASKKKYKPQHNDSFVWSVRHDRALSFLKGIVKYLIVKKPQATLILKKYKTVTHRAGKYTPKMLSDKMKLVATIRELNQR
jgi:hypothetical protein